MIIQSLLAIAVSLPALSPSLDADARCVEAAMWTQMQVKGDPKAEAGAQSTGSFYLGRLTMAQPTIDWLSLLKTRDAKDHRPIAEYTKDSEFCVRNMAAILRFPALPK